MDERDERDGAHRIALDDFPFLDDILWFGSLLYVAEEISKHRELARSPISNLTLRTPHGKRGLCTHQLEERERRCQAKIKMWEGKKNKVKKSLLLVENEINMDERQIDVQMVGRSMCWSTKLTTTKKNKRDFQMSCSSSSAIQMPRPMPTRLKTMHTPMVMIAMTMKAMMGIAAIHINIFDSARKNEKQTKKKKKRKAYGCTCYL